MNRPSRHRSVRRLLLTLLAVLVAALLVGEAAARVLGPLPPDRVWPDQEAQVKAEHAEVIARSGTRERLIFAGSSISDAAFDPSVVTTAAGWDISSYNYAQEGSAAATESQFLQAVAIPKVKPDIVVVGLTPNEINDGGTRQRELEDVQLNSRGYRQANGNPTVGDRLANFAARHSELLGHRQVLRDPYRLFRDRGRGTVSEFNDVGTGALLRHRDTSYRVQTTKRANEPSYGNFSAGGHQVEALEALVRWSGLRGVRVLFVELPVYRSGFDQVVADGPRTRREAHAALVALAADTCTDLLDLRAVLQTEDFWDDAVHVNGRGTVAVSQAVGRWLASLGPGAKPC